MSKIALISGSGETSKALRKQLGDFIPEDFEIINYIGDDGIFLIEACDLEIYSSKAMYEEVLAQGLVKATTPKIIGKRTINYDQLDLVVSIPDRTPVLLVNDLELTVEETRLAMVEIGLDHIDMGLYYPGADLDLSQYKVAITPGEVQYVPIHIDQIIDIGPRIFDFTTIAKILSHLNLLEVSSGSFSKMYLEKIIKIAKGLAQSRNEVVKLNSNLERVIDSFNEGLIMFDQQFKVVVFNDVLKQILKARGYKFVGNMLNRVIHNKKLLLFLMDEKMDQSQNIHLDGNEYVVTKFKMDQNDLICASFKSSKAHYQAKEARLEALRKGHVAKYDLTDLVGESSGMVQVRNVVRKLAKTDMTILIQGESGTGKELTASAIHKHSNRAEEPFLAVNFSALPDDLIESELFGYTEGAFTGAKKGGKTGLFEEANGGTIFLDEIGDISLKVQLRLLRVLEEKEIMPIGANEIRSIDVRIIAATNKDLSEMVAKNQFREDLYYRLKMGFIHLQPLRERREDIPVLCEHINQSIGTTAIQFEPELIKRLVAYHWPGNIRELKNSITYMLAVRKEDTLRVEDLPMDQFFNRSESAERVSSLIHTSEDIQHHGESLFLTEEEKHFLDMIFDFTRKDCAISRKTLAEASQSSRFVRTENQVRRILNHLKDKELLEIHKGRIGIQLTEKAYSQFSL